MPDLLAHVLFAFAAFEVASWRLDGLDGKGIPIGVIGATLPDAAKVRFLLPREVIESVFGVPFSWLALHRLGGALALAGIGAVLFPASYRRRAFGFLVAGAGTHLLLDAMIVRANGLAPPYLYPFSWWQPPAGGLYLSSDRWPVLVAAVLAGVGWIAGRRRT